MKKKTNLSETVKNIRKKKSAKKLPLHFNQTVFLDKVGEDEHFINTIFNIFFNNFATSFNMIKKAYLNNDKDAYFKTIHYLKGETATLCLDVLTEYFEKLEKSSFRAHKKIILLFSKIDDEFIWLKNNNIPF